MGSRQLLAGFLTMNAVLVLSLFVSQALGFLASTEECLPPTIGECEPSDYRCDLGSYAGCWLGSFCMPEGSIVPWPATSPPLPTVLLERFPATWDLTEAAGWEITACLMIQSALLPVTALLLLNVRWARKPVTWDPTKDVGKATSV